jgi:hypothetical protein
MERREIEAAASTDGCCCCALFYVAARQMPSRLIYSGSKEGFRFSTWLANCVGVGPTLLLVKVSEHASKFAWMSHVRSFS